MTLAIALIVILCAHAFPPSSAAQSAPTPIEKKASTEKSDPVTPQETLNIKEITDVARNIALIIGGLGTLIFAWIGVHHYLNDVEMKRITEALQLYNEFDGDPDCVRAMTMVDYYTREKEFTFKYDFHASQDPVTVNFSSTTFRAALEKPYKDLTDEERAIRFVMDVWLGWFERIFYCVEKGYFHVEELVFYRYWLDHLIDDRFDFVREYARKNTCGTLVPSLNKYKATIRSQLLAWLDTLQSSTHHSRLVKRPHRSRQVSHNKAVNRSTQSRGN